jgi:site-specific DNA-methyltransferase (adenine-specific)
MTTAWQVIHGDCLEVLPTLGQVDHVITDPPYSEKTHAAAAAAARDLPDGSKRRVYASGGNGFGFDHISSEMRHSVAELVAVCVRRWVLLFSDSEGVGEWMRACQGAGLDHVRIGHWLKVGAAPQFTGDRPGNRTEAIEIAHPRGRKRWNSGGKHALWEHPIDAIASKKSGEGRSQHLTPKPLSLMLELVADFTDPGDLVLDPFCGSGTTGVACLRLGRRFIGVEKDATYAAVARERLEAEARGLTLRDARAGQTSIFDAMGEP